MAEGERACRPPSTNFRLPVILFQNQFIFITKVVVAGNDDDIAWAQAFQYFIEIRVLTAYFDVLLSGNVWTGVNEVNPVTASFLVKTATR